MRYQVIIGLEIHIETKTKTKMFSSSSSLFDAPANTNVGVVDMAFPGTMPTVNKQAVKNAIMLAHALNMKIDDELHFDRKNYFYSDLPKGYQITQQRRPIGKDGYLDIFVGDTKKRVRIERVHMEEDTAKQIHLADITLIDYNRAGNPLVELVTRPDLRNAEEAMAFIEAVREIVTFLDISDGKMEEGSLRCDVNISLLPRGTTIFGNKVEIKNLNSISNVGKVIETEIKRQIAVYDSGETVISQTRRYDDVLKDTVAMRMKDKSVDYKYIPEGNILPISLSKEFIDETIAEMKELPSAKRDRYFNTFKLNAHEVNILLQDKDLTNYFDRAAQDVKNYKTLINWIIGEFSSYLNKEGKNAQNVALSPQNTAKLINLIDNDTISNSQARELFMHIVETNDDPETKAKALNLVQVSDTDFILSVINEVINENLHVIDDIKAGKDRAMGFLVGQVMKKTKGKVNPALASKLMKQEIDKK
ncbi:MAG: Aspartyl/glutamyl-tRNA(Asn/Gln) amidotransferase subunit B [Tenericutes bacterium ADurb.Bin239]|jgi:aspartyl-tRNA(Asn)/glutamyl-tRNA(Gln) amidotransferase subunit B|nr:MAG: Aspartyl/glutamyl-tRNA(Asn/Gln) amidotransferase subunit B [Tenericutes bacterium ADurb.Bin239]